MTHISQDLNRICTGWCPLCDTCSEEYECENRIDLRRLIWKIAGVKDEED